PGWHGKCVDFGCGHRELETRAERRQVGVFARAVAACSGGRIDVAADARATALVHAEAKARAGARAFQDDVERMADIAASKFLRPDGAGEVAEPGLRAFTAQPVAFDWNAAAVRERERAATGRLRDHSPEVVLPPVGGDDRHVGVAAPCGPCLVGDRY